MLLHVTACCCMLLHVNDSPTSHYAAQHVVRKLYERVDIDGKETVARLLDEAKEKLGQTKEGTDSGCRQQYLTLILLM